MKGDFTRNTFDPQKNFLRVLMQQGRVQLDADFNEQVSILLHYMQTFVADVVGPHFTVPLPGSTPTEWGFKIDGKINDWDDIKIGRGKYYVNGIPCENESPDGKSDHFIKIGEQEANPCEGFSIVDKQNPTLVYLDVWERHINYFQDTSIQEIALGGADTATRSKIIWQIKLAEAKGIVSLPKDAKDIPSFIRENWNDIENKVIRPKNRGLLQAQAKKQTDSTSENPCLLSSDARYVGTENQLYRVEIHVAGNKNDATFKWSKDNGSVVFPVLTLNGTKATLKRLERDSSKSLSVGDWVEIIDDHNVLKGRPGVLVQIETVSPDSFEVTYKIPDGVNTPSYQDNDKDRNKHPLLRRWDHRSDAEIPLKNGAISIADAGAEGEGKWIHLENGVEICFMPTLTNSGHIYQTGDYWLIPARTATGDIEWPKNPDGSIKSMAPMGIEHHYGPLAIFLDTNSGPIDCRCKITPTTCES